MLSPEELVLNLIPTFNDLAFGVVIGGSQTRHLSCSTRYQLLDASRPGGEGDESIEGGDDESGLNAESVVGFGCGI